MGNLSETTCFKKKKKRMGLAQLPEEPADAHTWRSFHLPVRLPEHPSPCLGPPELLCDGPAPACLQISFGQRGGAQEEREAETCLAT